MSPIVETSGKLVHETYTPLNPTFELEKKGFAGVYLVFLFLLQNIDCGYSLEPPWQRVPTIDVLIKNIKDIENVLLKNLFFYNFKNMCILHKHVFVLNQKSLFGNR